MASDPKMNASGDAAPATEASNAEMNTIPMVGERNATDMAKALGRPIAFRRSSP